MDNELLPKTLQEAIVRFADKDFAHSTAVSIVWPDGVPTCHRCGSKNAHFLAKSFRYRCRDCRKDFTVKVGTIFEDSPLGLDKWLPAMWLVINCKNGISSHEMARDLDITQKSAWFMNHRIREAMRTGTFRKMEGTIEAHQTYAAAQQPTK